MWIFIKDFLQNICSYLNQIAFQDFYPETIEHIPDEKHSRFALLKFPSLFNET